MGVVQNKIDIGFIAEANAKVMTSVAAVKLTADSAYEDVEKLNIDSLQVLGEIKSTQDLDEITRVGVYFINGTAPIHAPSGMANTFSCLLVLPTGGYGSDGTTVSATQIYIQGGWRAAGKHIALRGYGGSPSAWSVWHYLTDSDT